ncbi:MAG: IclR family transcriptional regulator [Planctomycetota bacterium]
MQIDRSRDSVGRIQSLDRGLELLEIISHGMASFSVTQLSAKTGLSKSTVSRLLATLNARRYVFRDKSRRFHLGFKVFELNVLLQRQRDVEGALNEVVARLADKSGESSHIAIFSQGEGLIQSAVDAKNMIAATFAPGDRFPLHSLASGKILAAFLPARELDQVLERLSARPDWRDVAIAQFKSDLATVREQGYAYDNRPDTTGVASIAAPLRDNHGEVIGALGVTGPFFRLDDDKANRAIEAVTSIAAEVSERLGYHKEKGQ